MARINFLYAEIKVYPASVEEGTYGADYKWDTLLIAQQPVLATFEHIGAFYEGRYTDIHKAIVRWVEQEALDRGKELIYQDCPKAPK